MRRATHSLLSLGLVMLLLTGCGRPPAVELPNLKLVSSLRTACSARNPQWLEGVAKAVEERQAQGELSDAAADHFRLLIAQARSGAWEEAERECLRFERAQLSRSRKT